MITEAKRRYSLPVRSLATDLGLSPATLTRWKRRLRQGQAAVGRRGPRKVKPLNFDELKERIQGLGHVRKRSRGSGSLHRTYADGISRRDLDAMVRAVRQETSRNRVANTYHVSWLRPNLAWAMDDCEKTEHGAGGMLHLHNLTDLHSRYRLQTPAGQPLFHSTARICP
jgi:transposase-like protein